MATATIQAKTESLRFCPPPVSQACFSVASALLPGALVLADAHETRREALVFLLGHITEVLLKSIALKSGSNESDLMKREVRHNLVKLWEYAAKEREQLQAPVPPWVVGLNKFHDFPHVLRYMKGVAFHSLPAIEPVLEGVPLLYEQAKKLLEPQV